MSNAQMNNTPASASCEVCPLSRVQTGVAVRIKQLCAAPEVQNRLREIGLCEDQVVKLITSRNNLICQVCNSRLAISEQLAQMIMVEPVLCPIRVEKPFKS
ncbi:MAG TPA: FeoA family protein [Candidatus Paceibacterota bacterium]|nr:FeoA family protein [Candidatus Paceibacterota bacterium]